MAVRTLPGLGLTGGWALRQSGWGDPMNVNLRLLSAMTQLSVISQTTALPGSPSDGDIYIVPSGAGSNANEIAVRDEGAWVYFVPVEGFEAWVQDTNLKMVFEASAWRPILSIDPSTGGVTFPGSIDIGYNTASGWKSLTIHHSATHGGGYLVQRDGGSPFTGLSGFDNGTTQRALYVGGGGWGAIDANQISMYTAPSYASGVDGGVRRLTITAAGDVVVGTNLAEVTISSTRHFHLRSYTVATLPTPGTAGRLAYASNCRVFDGAGTQEGAGLGTGSVVADNGTAWKISGTNVTAVA